MAARKNSGAKYEFSNLSNDQLRDKIEELAGTIVEGSKKELDAETRKANGVMRRKITNARIQLFDRIGREADAQASAILDRQDWADAAARNEAWHELRLHLATEIGNADRAAWEAARGIVTETETADEIAEEVADYTITTEDGAVIAEVSHIELTAQAGEPVEEPVAEEDPFAWEGETQAEPIVEETTEEPTLGEIAKAHAAAGKHNRKRKTFDVECTKKGDYIIHPAGKRRQLTRVPRYSDVESFLEGFCGETHWPNVRHLS